MSDFESVEEELKFMADMSDNNDDDESQAMFIRYLGYVRKMASDYDDLSQQLAASQEREAALLTEFETYKSERLDAYQEIVNKVSALERQRDALQQLLNERDQQVDELGQQLAGSEPKPVEDAVGIVDESDDGIFIDLIYGENGNPLKRGDLVFTRPAPAGVVADKYDEVLAPFMAMMRAELHANAAKGDRPGWLGMTAEQCLLEIYYHVSKLQKAVRDGNGDRIIENTADVANMAMMLADICGALGIAQLSPMAKVAAMMDVKSQQEWAQHPSNPASKLNGAPK